MALVTVYDQSGQPLSVEPIDARELLKFGGYTQEPPEPETKVEAQNASLKAATEEELKAAEADAKAKADAEAAAKDSKKK